MPTFLSNTEEIDYIVEGDGPPILLLHGFGSSIDGNWRKTGVIETLTGSGRQVVALDFRGHGHSSKPHSVDAYAETAMEDDVEDLLDYLEIADVNMMGYSMGASDCGNDACTPSAPLPDSNPRRPR